MYKRGAMESVLHRFWECPFAKISWDWAIHILNALVARNGEYGPWRPLTWKQGIFSDRIPRRFDNIQKIWMAIQGTVVWMLSMERNDAIFNDIKWSSSKLRQKNWLDILDYGRLDWEAAKLKVDNKFQEVWCNNKVLAVMERGKPSMPRWKLFGP
jgi:hypothetical protein